MNLRLRWLQPNIVVSENLNPDWGLVVENPGEQTAAWSGTHLIAIGSLRTESGDAITGTGHPLVIPSIKKRHSLEQGEVRPLRFVVPRLRDEDLWRLGSGTYEVVVESCTIPPPVELPPTLGLRFASTEG